MNKGTDWFVVLVMGDVGDRDVGGRAGEIGEIGDRRLGTLTGPTTMWDRALPNLVPLPSRHQGSEGLRAFRPFHWGATSPVNLRGAEAWRDTLLELRSIIHRHEVERERLRAKVSLLAMQRDYWQERCAERAMSLPDRIRASSAQCEDTGHAVPPRPAGIAGRRSGIT